MHRFQCSSYTLALPRKPPIEMLRAPIKHKRVRNKAAAAMAHKDKLLEAKYARRHHFIDEKYPMPCGQHLLLTTAWLRMSANDRQVTLHTMDM